MSALRLRNTKKGERYGSFNLEDKTGFIEVITWPDVYRKCAELIGADDPIFVKGRMEVGEERIQVIANEVRPLSEVAAKAEALLDELRPESPLRHRLRAELEELRRLRLQKAH